MDNMDFVFVFGLFLGIFVTAIVLSATFSIISVGSDELFCVGEFGHDTIAEYKNNSNYCVKVLDNGQVAQREIIKVDGEWHLKDGLLEPTKLLTKQKVGVEK